MEKLFGVLTMLTMYVITLKLVMSVNSCEFLTRLQINSFQKNPSTPVQIYFPLTCLFATLRP